jgi:ribonuclease PH
MTDTPTLFERPDGRAIGELREIRFQTGIAPHALGSVLVCFGDTRVICAASIDERVPGWMRAQKIEGGLDDRGVFDAALQHAGSEATGHQSR